MGYRHANENSSSHGASLARQLVLAVDDSRALKHNGGGGSRTSAGSPPPALSVGRERLLKKAPGVL